MSFKKCEREIMQAIERGARAAVTEISKKIPVAIYDRTKNGIGVPNVKSKPNGQPSIALKKLNPGTIRRRQNTKLGPRTSPSKSNFTRTGDTLENIKTSHSDVTKTVTIEIAKKDQKKVKDNVKQNRKWFALTASEVNQACRIVGFSIVKFLKRLG